MYFLIEDKIVINQAENLILKSKNDAFRQHFWNMTFRQPRAKVVETVCIFIAIYCFYGSVDFCTPPPAAMLFRSDLFVARRSIVNIETGRGGEDSVEWNPDENEVKEKKNGFFSASVSTILHAVVWMR